METLKQSHLEKRSEQELRHGVADLWWALSTRSTLSKRIDAQMQEQDSRIKSLEGRRRQEEAQRQQKQAAELWSRLIIIDDDEDSENSSADDKDADLKHGGAGERKKEVQHTTGVVERYLDCMPCSTGFAQSFDASTDTRSLIDGVLINNSGKVSVAASEGRDDLAGSQGLHMRSARDIVIVSSEPASADISSTLPPVLEMEAPIPTLLE